MPAGFSAAEAGPVAAVDHDVALVLEVRAAAGRDLAAWGLLDFFPVGTGVQIDLVV